MGGLDVMGKLAIQVLPATSSVVLICLLLEGCGQSRNQLQGPVALGLGSDGLEIAVCESIDASTLVLEARIDGEWSNAWVGQGGARIAAGTVITGDNIDDLFSDSDIQRRDFAGYSDLTVRISSVAGGENVVAAFEPGLLEDGTWLHPDDSHSADACDSDG